MYMIGTLVVCLLSLFQGGELLVSYDCLQHLFVFLQKRTHKAAFQRNCVHEVKPVLESQKVTITYNVTTSECPTKLSSVYAIS